MFYSGNLAAVIADAEKRGADRAIATVREWVEKQKQRAVDRQTELNREDDLDSWLKNRGAEQFAIGLIAYLDRLAVKDEVVTNDH